MLRTKRIAVIIGIFLMLSCSASAEVYLYPIRENGKWGYMNQQGEIIIPAQWQYAEPFHHGVAVVSNRDDALLPQDDLCGLIDSKGNYLLEPVCQALGNYRFAEPGEDGRMAYYDPVSGYLSSFQYSVLFGGWKGELLIYVPENGTFDSPYGFLNPSTGEAVTLPIFDGLYDDVGCSEGYILAAFEKGYQTDGEIWGPDYHLYTLDGEEIHFPEGISPCSRVCGGVLIVERQRTDEEQAAKKSGWGVAYGLAKADGSILLPPIYDYVSSPYPGGGGRVSFWENGLNGFLDLEGHVVVPPCYRIETGGGIPEIYYQNGYALITDEISKRHLILDLDGNEIYTVPIWDEDGQKDLYGVYSNGCFWECTVSSGEKKYSLMRLENGHAIRLTDALFDNVGDSLPFFDIEAEITDGFSEGLCPVKLNGQYGFINEDGKVVIEPAWDHAGYFHNGLAMVMKQDKIYYINHDGRTVWKEE